MAHLLDRSVRTLLTGLDLEKYIPLFEKNMVNMQLFTSLNDEDLKLIGIEDERDIQLLSKYIKKFQSNSLFEKLQTFKDEELTKILKNTESHTYKIDLSVSYVLSKVKAREPKNFLLPSNESMSSVISIYSDHLLAETEKLFDDVGLLIKDVEIESLDE